MDLRFPDPAILAYRPCVCRLRAQAHGLGYSSVSAKRAGSPSTYKLKASGWDGFPGTLHKLHLLDIPVNPWEQNIQEHTRVGDSGGERPYQAVANLDWFDDEGLRGKRVKIHGFPRDYKVQLFRVAATNRTEYIATNDLSQDSAVVVKDLCGVRWKIEQYHREGKQMLGIEKCQCRKARAQKNHIGCVILAWHALTQWARKRQTNIYALKNSLLSEYMKKELRNPTISILCI